MWMDRARVFKPLQAKAGMRTVAAELASAMAAHLAPPPVTHSPHRLRVDTVDEEDQVTKIAPLAIQIPEPEAVSTRLGLSPQTEATVPKAVLSFPREIPADAPLEVPDRVARPADGRARPPPKLPAAVPASAEDVTAEVSIPTNVMPDRAAPRPVMPTSREVLAALRNAGVFEPRETGAGPVEWNRPESKGLQEGRRRAVHGHGSLLGGLRGDARSGSPPTRGRPSGGGGGARQGRDLPRHQRGVAAPRGRADHRPRVRARLAIATRSERTGSRSAR